MTAPGTVSPQPLVARFDQRSGEMMVYGGGFACLFVLSLAIARGEWAFYLASLVLLGVALHFWPFVNGKVPALVASSAGLKISGLGTLAWSAISNAETIDKAIRTIRNAELHLTLSQPLEQALLEPDGGGLPRRLMVQIARVEGDQLIVKLEPLNASPEAILETVSGYLKRL